MARNPAPLPWQPHAQTVDGFALSVHASIEALPPAARAALDDAQHRAIYAGTEWFRLFTREVPPGPDARDEWWVVGRGDDDTPLVLPMRRNLHTRTLQALANFYTPTFAPAGRVDAARLDALAAAWRRGPLAAQRVTIEPIEPVEPAAPVEPDGAASAGWGRLLSASLARAGWLVREAESTANWRLLVVADGAATWAQRPGALRNTAARMGRRFARDGGRLECITGDDRAALDRGLAAYAEVYARSWKPPEGHPGFVPGLLALAARQRWLRLGIAWVGDRPVAVQAWLVHAGVAGIYKLAYDEEAARWSPGTLLGRMLLMHVIDVDRVRTIDYLTGDDDYKKLWMTERRSLRRIDAMAPWSAAGWRERARRLLRRDAASPG